VEERVLLVAADTPRWWNLDLYLAGVISYELRDYIKNAGERVIIDVDELTDIADKLERYKDKFNADNSLGDETRLTREGQEAMRKLAEIFPTLWT
jgi:hypothetical protein